MARRALTSCLTRLLLGIGILSGVTSAAAAVADAVAYTPVQFRTVSGIRPFVEVRLNGKPFLFMIHSGADFYAMTTHANAQVAGISNLQGNVHYGISSPGHVSDLGRSETTLDSLSVGSSTWQHVPLSVFEVPQDPVMQGMLGVGWLRANHVIVDYASYRVGLPGSIDRAKGEDERLVKEGYVVHAMTWSEEHKAYFVQGTLDGVATRFLVATVAETVIDTDFAKKSGIAMGPVVSENAGPSGALVNNYIPRDPAIINIDGQHTASTLPLMFDLYAYGSHSRSAISSENDVAHLGADFMLVNKAVIDFGTGTLLLKQ